MAVLWRQIGAGRHVSRNARTTLLSLLLVPTSIGFVGALTNDFYFGPRTGGGRSAVGPSGGSVSVRTSAAATRVASAPLASANPVKRLSGGAVVAMGSDPDSSAAKRAVASPRFGVALTSPVLARKTAAAFGFFAIGARVAGQGTKQINVIAAASAIAAGSFQRVSSVPLRSGVALASAGGGARSASAKLTGAGAMLPAGVGQVAGAARISTGQGGVVAAFDVVGRAARFVVPLPDVTRLVGQFVRGISMTGIITTRTTQLTGVWAPGIALDAHRRLP